MTVAPNSPQFLEAVNCARTRWLKELLVEFLPLLIPLTNSKGDLEKAQQLYSAIEERFVDRGLISPSQQKNRITDVRNAIKVFDPQHPVLNVVGLSSSEWIEINSVAASQTTNRSTQFLKNPNAIAQKAGDLLKSNKWSDLAAGLAVVTGRRVSEVLKTAEFELVSTYSVMFVGAAKRRGETVPLKFEIPTLVDAPSVISAISKLRSLLDTQGLTNRQINDKYEQAVARSCDRHFRDLVPSRDGKSNLYSHLFRAVYATIASHWFCPPSVSDLEFRASIQGHFKILDQKNPTQQTDMASSRHYWDYKISDGEGNVDGRLGIRLHEDGVEVLKAFAPHEKTEAENLGRLVKITVSERDRSTLALIQDRFALATRASANHFVLNLAKAAIDAADKLGISPSVLVERLDRLDEFSLPRSEAEGERSPDVSQVVDEEDSIVEDGLEKSDSTRLLFEKMDEQLDHMSQQQHSLDRLTAAIGDLVRVIRTSRAPGETPGGVSSSPQVSLPHESDSSRSDLLQETKATRKQNSENTPKKQSSKVGERKRHSMQTRHKVNQYIDAIMAFNDVLDRPHGEKWAISVAALKRLALCGQHPVYAVINSRQSEIDAHHHKHQLTPTHNKKDRSFPKIESVISL